MAKYTLHNSCGDFMSVTSRSLEKIKKDCDTYNKNHPNGGYYVAESYLAPSPFNNKMVEHGKKIYPI